MMKENIYYLMNKNNHIATLVLINGTFYIKEIKTTQFTKALYNIDKWINNRMTIVGRDNLLTMAKIAQIDSEDRFVELTKAISITDTFWVNSKNNPTTWDKISPYTNTISRIIANIAIDGLQLFNNQNLSSPSPQYKIGGSVDKCVKRINGKEGIYLYKSCGEIKGNADVKVVRPYSEYFVSKFLDMIGMQYNRVYYYIDEKVTDDGNIKPYSVCKIFTNENTGLLEIGDSVYARTPLDELLNIFKDNGDRVSYSTLKNMLMIDAITLNIDRHSWNYGMLIDNDTLTIKSMAPIYDNDCALGSTISLRGKSFADAYEEIVTHHLPRTDTGDYNDTALLGMTQAWYNKLRQINGKIKLERGKLTGISQNRIDFMNYVINRRVAEIINVIKQTYHLSK